MKKCGKTASPLYFIHNIWNKITDTIHKIDIPNKRKYTPEYTTTIRGSRKIFRTLKLEKRMNSISEIVDTFDNSQGYRCGKTVIDGKAVRYFY